LNTHLIELDHFSSDGKSKSNERSALDNQLLNDCSCYEKVNANLINSGVESNEELEKLSLARKYAVASAVFFSLSRCVLRWFMYYYPNSDSDYFMFIRLLGISFIGGVVILQYTRKESEESPMNNSSLQPKKLESLLYIFRVNHSAETFTEKYSCLFLLARSILLAANMFLYYLSFSNLKLGVAAVLLQIQPIFLNILTYFILQEKGNNKYFIAFFVAIVGVYIMTQGLIEDIEDEASVSIKNIEALGINSPKNELLGYVSGVFAALSVAFMYVFSNIAGKKIDGFNFTYVGSFWSAVIFLLFSLALGRIDSLMVFTDIWFLFISFCNCLVSFGAFYCVQIAISLSQVSKVSYLFYCQIPFTSIMAMVLFGEILNMYELIGGSIIVCNLVVTTILLK